MTAPIPADVRREADAAAREGTQRLISPLWRELRRHTTIDRNHPVHVVEIGEGADRSWLASRLPFPARWIAVGADGSGVEDALTEAGGRPSVVLSSGELDRVSPARLDALADALLVHRTPALFGLLPDGHVTLAPRHDDDEALVSAAHRRRRGLGEAGVDAVSRLTLRLRTGGARVVEAATPWRLTGGQAPLVERYLTHLVEGAVAHDAALDAVGRRWLDRRRADLEEGHLALVVGHVDLLVIPGDAPTLPLFGPG